MAQLRVAIPRVELAAGHDGILRGAPEPALVLAAFLVREGGAALLGRGLRRLVVRNRFPAVVDLADAVLFEARETKRDADSVLLLAVALEEDDGRDVREIFAAMETPERLTLWHESDREPVPRELAEHVQSAARVPAPVRVLLEGRDLRDVVSGDDWVGAASAVVPLTVKAHHELRFRLCSDDGRNDWTAVIDVRVR